MNSLQLFQSYFQKEPSITSSANGRINLIGEHTDYNNGFVLPTLISQSIEVSIKPRDDEQIVCISNKFGELSSKIAASNDGTWLDFVRGAIYYIKKLSPTLKGIDIAVSSTIPNGSGLSSSAALEISLLRAFAQLQSLAIVPKEMAKIGQQIEHQFVGTQCGIMDQMVSACGVFGQAIFLDCESLQTKSLPLFPNHTFIVIHSGSTRKLSQGSYNERKLETMMASKTLNVPSLRYASLEQIKLIEDPTIRRRVKHIISENNRVIQATSCLEKNDAKQFGELMNFSHQSMRDDYEISSDELNKIVESASNNGALGARLTGAGFGGCVIVLSENEKAELITQSILSQCTQAYLVTTISGKLNS
tara:strand:+ start:340 stop:1422 length:1083 start_codon:yes stop_codon:yes gene_type:complete